MTSLQQQLTAVTVGKESLEKDLATTRADADRMVGEKRGVEEEMVGHIDFFIFLDNFRMSILDFSAMVSFGYDVWPSDFTSILDYLPLFQYF